MISIRGSRYTNDGPIQGRIQDLGKGGGVRVYNC